MIIGLLGLQGAFLDHIPHLNRLGAAHSIVRDAKGLGAVDRLIIPGGESTVMAKFLKEFGMVTPLQERIAGGMPVWGICAGAILLARDVDGRRGPLNALPAGAIRNAYGRQIQSSQRWVNVPLFDRPRYPAIFIRAPRIVASHDQVTVHARLDEDPVFIQYRRILATTFHPELTGDDLFHRYFLSI